jgi:hypothetical protein
VSAVDWWRAAGAWVVVLVLAVMNGAVREKVLLPRWGLRVAYAASGLMLSSCIVAVAYLTAPWFGAMDRWQWWALGGAWLVWTLLFEFVFGWLRRKSLSELAAAYTFRDGNLWPFVLVVTLAAPWLGAKLRGYV